MTPKICSGTKMLREKANTTPRVAKSGIPSQQNARVTDFAYPTNQYPKVTTQRLVVAHLYAVRVVPLGFLALNDAK
jgi:hypothetical protein